MLTSPVRLHDIDDAEAFVKAMIGRVPNLRLTPDEREELIADGLVELAALARRYDRQRDTGANPSFAGYASYLLPRKLSDAYHRARPHHVLRTQPDGSRRYEYLEPAVSLDSKREKHDSYLRNSHVDLADDFELRARRVGDFVPVPSQEAA